MKKIILLFCTLNFTIILGQTINYNFIPKDLHLVSETDTAFFSKKDKKSVDLDNVRFYNTKGKKLGKLNAAIQLQVQSNSGDIFLDDKNNIKVIVIRAKTEEEIETAKLLAANPKKSDFISIPSPSFTLTLLNGEIISFDPKQNHNLYVINFWYTGCAPCKAEMPELNNLVEKYKDKSVTFIAVTFEDKNRIEKFLKTRDFKYQMAISGAETIKKFEILSFPTNLIIDQQGDIIFKEDGLTQGIFDKLDKIISDNLK